MNYQTFTDTVTPTLKSLGSFNNSLKIVLKTVFTTRISNIISDTGRCEGYCYWEYDVVSLNASILSNPENYAKAVAEFSIYGKADDGFKFYLNGTNITTFASVCNHGSCTSKSDWIPSLHSFEYSLTSKTNNLLIKAYSIKNDYWAEIYSAILTIKTESKQFTNTVKTSVSTFSANLNNSIQLVNIYTIKGSNVAECHVFDIVDVWKLLYILNISVKSNNIEKAYITATLTAEGDDEFIFKLNNSYNMSLPSNAGSCMTCSACGNYTNFYKNSTKTFDVTQYLQDTNSIYVYFHNFTGGYSYKISNLEFTIKTYSKLQFTDTITSKATQLLSNSISTNLAIQNQETFTFKALDPGSNQVVGYSKSYIFTKKLRASFKYAKHIIVKFSGTANDYATINLNLGGNNYNYQSNASYYFAGCYSSVKPDGSFVDFVNYNLDQNINFNNNQVNVKITQHGTCSLWTDISVQGSILVQYKQFTDTINTVNPDCNVKAETKYQSVNITLPFNLVISPQDRWCEIHLSRVDYITTVSGGFPNTAVRVDFTSSSGHDPNYSNRIMYFDANGNLTFSNFCTQQSHSGSVDTWNITYMGKHYHFTIHWYW